MINFIKEAIFMASFIPIETSVIMSVNTVGASLTGGEFTVGIFNQEGEELFIATNDASGLISFPALRFFDKGEYNYTVKQTTAPIGWNDDTTEWPINFNVLVSDNKLHVQVSYPNGVPIFINTYQSAAQGLIKFPELTMSAPGTYEYTIKELTLASNGWNADNSVIRVIVSVVDDGHGNLVALVNYPDGFPIFTNAYSSS